MARCSSQRWAAAPGRLALAVLGRRINCSASGSLTRGLKPTRSQQRDGSSQQECRAGPWATASLHRICRDWPFQARWKRLCKEASGKADHHMRRESLEFLKTLIGAPSPSGDEGPAAKLYRDCTEGFADRVTTDVHGNVTAVLNPDATPVATVRQPASRQHSLRLIESAEPPLSCGAAVKIQTLSRIPRSNSHLSHHTAGSNSSSARMGSSPGPAEASAGPDCCGWARSGRVETKYHARASRHRARCRVAPWSGACLAG